MQNTNTDLVDCICAIEDEGLSALSDSERAYAKRLYENCQDFISVYEDAMYNEEEDDDE